MYVAARERIEAGNDFEGLLGYKAKLDTAEKAELPKEQVEIIFLPLRYVQHQPNPNSAIFTRNDGYLGLKVSRTLLKRICLFHIQMRVQAMRDIGAGEELTVRLRECDCPECEGQEDYDEEDQIKYVIKFLNSDLYPKKVQICHIRN